MRPIGFKQDAWEVLDTAAFIKNAKGNSSTRGARKSKKKYSRYLKHSENNRINKLINNIIE